MNILLIDDEEFVLEYLEEGINSLDLNTNQLLKATSVDEALEIIDNQSISIIISDISMPEKSGLDLLFALNKADSNIKTILLSGHSEFDFAKKALQYGAVDYLLKPLLIDELEEVLRKVISDIDEAETRRQRLEMAKYTLRINTSKAREQFLLDLLHGKSFSSTKLSGKIHTLNLESILSEECIIATVQLEIPAAQPFDVFRNALLNIAEEVFMEKINDPAKLWSCEDYYNFINFVIPSSIVNHSFAEALSKWTKIKEVATQFLEIKLAVILTYPFKFEGNFHSQYLKNINGYLSIPKGNLYSVHIQEERTPASNYKTLTKLNATPTILQLLESKRWEETNKKIDSVLKELTQGIHYSHNQLIEVVYYLFSCFSYISHKSVQGNSVSEDLSLIYNPFHFTSTEQIKNWAYTFINQLSRADSNDYTESTFLISQIHTFIEENIKEDVSLKKIGEHVYLHPVYLSRMYKKETGESISSYILKVRMEKAVLLLTTTNRNVSDIALEVGYRKTQYFIQLFKEYYQRTPQRYRNQYR